MCYGLFNDKRALIRKKCSVSGQTHYRWVNKAQVFIQAFFSTAFKPQISKTGFTEVRESGIH